MFFVFFLSLSSVSSGCRESRKRLLWVSQFDWIRLGLWLESLGSVVSVLDRTVMEEEGICYGGKWGFRSGGCGEGWGGGGGGSSFLLFIQFGYGLWVSTKEEGWSPS